MAYKLNEKELAGILRAAGYASPYIAFLAVGIGAALALL